ncbi:serine acetyltransferase [Leishmania major strain Friedlin]|uniref:serine O-acetyltransferase n=1 Tax=Leishmania major TaxID=5664 RepID=Q4Q2Q9_LEIMA|nr:serine acetyltransferase [Leishmania major strain Friedlin]CAG9582163.1 serine_acetyltransferase [Leishmania major strain Friedlin]CAJ08006.1 serine acetyltransferase [Leishmania major strain Friedlin]|eukprot:XP_001686389.1 serine acetyltransferase [Leishmania major strain Friedlin]
MKRLDRIREALEQLNPQRADSTLPTFHPRISLHKLKELVECLFYVFFPECTNPPSEVTPTFAEADSLMEWVIGHIADILVTQIYVAFVLHGDAHAVEDTKPFKPLNTSQRTQLEWNGQRCATLSLLAMESRSTKGGFAVAAAAEQDALKASLEELSCTGNRARLPSTEVSSKSAASKANAMRVTADINSSANQDFLTNCKRRADAIVTKFVVERLAHVHWLLHTDVEAIFKGDVAASSPSEVVLCYPGLRCMVHQRVAHQLHLLGVPQNFTRMLTELAHSETGIDIHPNTAIGHHFFIDHGTGVVIGATAVIGNDVSIYQGVTLGARSFPTDEKTGERIRDLPRHPIIEDGVTLYANAVVLGRVTIGERSTIGGNCWVVRDVPPFSAIVQRSHHVLQPHERMFLEGDGSGI